MVKWQLWMLTITEHCSQIIWSYWISSYLGPQIFLGLELFLNHPCFLPLRGHTSAKALWDAYPIPPAASFINLLLGWKRPIGDYSNDSKHLIKKSAKFTFPQNIIFTAFHGFTRKESITYKIRFPEVLEILRIIPPSVWREEISVTGQVYSKGSVRGSDKIRVFFRTVQEHLSLKHVSSQAWLAFVRVTLL